MAMMKVEVAAIQVWLKVELRNGDNGVTNRQILSLVEFQWNTNSPLGKNSGGSGAIAQR